MACFTVTEYEETFTFEKLEPVNKYFYSKKNQPLNYDQNDGLIDY